MNFYFLFLNLEFLRRSENVHRQLYFVSYKELLLDVEITVINLLKQFHYINTSIKNRNREVNKNKNKNKNKDQKVNKSENENSNESYNENRNSHWNNLIKMLKAEKEKKGE